MSGFFKIFFRNSGEKNKIVRSVPRSSHGGKVISDKKKRGSSRIGGAIFLRIFTWILISGFVGVVGYVLFFSPFMMIDEISIRGEENLKKEDVLTVVESSLSGKYLDVLQKNNFILASKGNIKNDLRGKFKRIEDVAVAKEFPNKLAITIKEIRANLLFCSGDFCWVINERGKAFAKADFSANEFGESSLVVLRDTNSKDITQEDIWLEEDLMRFVLDVKDGLENGLNIGIKKECSTPAIISGDLRIETVQGWKIYLNKNLGSEKTLEMLKIILANNIDQEKRANLEYIDLRVNNKAYYKLKKIEGSENEDIKNDSGDKK